MRLLFSALFLISSFVNLGAQNLGLSFSYFIPKNGYFSTPISPFSIRGIGVDITRHIALETGASLYRMTGLSMKDLPMASKEPFVGPNFTIFVPAELVFQFKGSSAELDLKGGVFGFYGFSQKLNYGNIDRAIREWQNWEVANSTLTFQNKPGWGYHVGAELTLYLNAQFGISLETNYLVGASALPLKGHYSGGNQTIERIEVGESFSNGKIDFTGLEFSIGLIFNTEAGGPPKRKNSRRRR